MKGVLEANIGLSSSGRCWSVKTILLAKPSRKNASSLLSIWHYKLCWPHHTASLCTKEGKVPKKGTCKETPAKITVSSTSCKPGNSKKNSSRILQLAMRSVFQWKGDNKSWYLALNKSKSSQGLLNTSLRTNQYKTLILWYWQIPTSYCSLPIKK